MEKKSANPHGNIVAFLSALLICCGFYILAIYLHNGHIIEGQNRIIRTYVHQVEKLETRKVSANIRDSQREKEMEAFHQEVKSLLELEFNRIQNEFEAIEIWTGILTVIFLIFSFYSLFKTEQLENQGKDELMRIKKISEDGTYALGKFDTGSKTKLKEVDDAVDKIRKEAKESIDAILSKGQSDSLTLFDQRAKEILETYKNLLNEQMAKNLKDIEKSHDVYLKKLQNAAENDIDSDENVEEELDEEELRKDKDSEEKEK